MIFWDFRKKIQKVYHSVLAISIELALKLIKFNSKFCPWRFLANYRLNPLDFDEKVYGFVLIEKKNHHVEHLNQHD